MAIELEFLGFLVYKEIEALENSGSRGNLDDGTGPQTEEVIENRDLTSEHRVV
ncbi:MAG: hypothetical protein HQ559_06960 [Lentisphaerae bacterium]|nr:hypothetical protein [Lentisphaerota bacterium]